MKAPRIKYGLCVLTLHQYPPYEQSNTALALNIFTARAQSYKENFLHKITLRWFAALWLAGYFRSANHKFYNKLSVKLRLKVLIGSAPGVNVKNKFQST